MKLKYFLFIIIAMFGFMIETKALEINNCQVILTIKYNTDKEAEDYICKGKEYGNSSGNIYYSGKSNVINLNYANFYYISNEDSDIVINISGKNQISYFHLNNKSKVEITGNGSLKFKDNSYVNKYYDGKPVYYYLYNGKVILNSDKKRYESTLDEFVSNYDELIKINKLPQEYNEDDYELIHVIDYQKLSSITITESWLEKNITTKLKTSIVDGFGVVEYKEPNNELQTDDIILISKEKVDSKYELNVDDIKNKDIGEKVSSDLDENDLISFYNVSIVDEKSNSNIKKGNFTIKLKINEDYDKYEDYQIIYVDDNGQIKEYLNHKIEDGYIVFNTSHLSYYGVIAKEKFVPISVTINGDATNSNSVLLLKIMLLVGIVMMSLALLMFVVIKSNLLPKRKKRKNKFIKYIKRTLLSK